MLVEGAKWRFSNVRDGLDKRFLWLHGAYFLIYAGLFAYVYYVFSIAREYGSTM